MFKIRQLYLTEKIKSHKDNEYVFVFMVVAKAKEKRIN